AGILGTGGGAGTVIMGGPIIMFGGAAAMFGTDHCCGVVMNGCVGDIAPGPIIIMGFITGGGAMGMGIAGGARKPGQPALGRVRLPAAGVGQHAGGHLAVAGVGQHAGGHLAVAGVGQHAGGHLAAAGVGQHDGHLWQGLSWRWLALGLGCVRLAVVAVVAVVRASLVVRESLVVLPDPLTLEGAALELACGRVVGRQVTWAALVQDSVSGSKTA
ncbi:unnamed protein product, partial [Effrenium voratum]